MEIIKITNKTTLYSTVSFFLIVPIGLEDLAKHELYEKLDLFFPDAIVPEIEMTSGGILLNWDLHNGLLLNLILKIPTRILLRVDEFKCRDFPKLYKKIQGIPWKLFFCHDQVTIKSTAHQSRIFHSKRIEKSAMDGIKHFFQGNPPKKKEIEYPAGSQSIFLRLDNDLCTVSIDTSGDALYKRGQKTFTTAAPIRENLAAALLYNVSRLLHKDNIEFIDPMCGSGTFLFEAANFYKPHSKRNFSFNFWPLVIRELGNCDKNLYSDFHSSFHPQFYKKLTGYDIEKEVIEVTRKNLLNYDDNNISFHQRDVMSEDIPPQKHSENVIILNPPYGVRIPTFDHIENFYHHIFEKLEKDFKPKILGIIIPCGFSYRKILISGHKLIEKRQFSNGGLKVQFHIFTRIEE